MQRKGPVRDRKKEREWRDRVRRWERSGESVRAFCRRESLRESAFFAWRRELARRREERQAVRAEKKKHARSSTPAKPVRFLPVRVAVENRTDDSGGVEILLDAGRAIRVRPGFDRQTLADVLAVMEASPC
jgi:transposase